jgi:exosortase A
MSLGRVAARELLTGPPVRSFGWLCAMVVAVVLMFWNTAASMVDVWNSSATYSHGFVVLPAFFWLVWKRKDALASLPVRPTWAAFAVLSVLGSIWLLGDMASVALLTQFAVVCMVPAATAAVLGAAWVRTLMFPFAFLFFAVPFGDAMVPTLMDWTADFTVAALKASGVPVYRDGLHFAIPSGNWSVVDSCSGIRYVFACLTLSSLYGWLIFRSNLRRWLFVGFALLVAIVANWIRAYAIVLLGHLSNNEIATGADHLVYGGVFFGLIMALLFGVGALWREDRLPGSDGGAPERQAASAEALADVPRQWRRGLAAGTAVLVTMSIWPSVSWATGERLIKPAAVIGEVRGQGGWTSVAEPVASWQPRLHNPASVQRQTFTKDGRKVGIHIGGFLRPSTESKLTSALNRLLEPNGLDRQWKLAQQDRAQLGLADMPVAVRSATLLGSDARLLVWQWYWVDGEMTGTPWRAAWLQMIARLRGHSEHGGWVSIFTLDDGDARAASNALQSFIADMAGQMDLALRPAASTP